MKILVNNITQSGLEILTQSNFEIFNTKVAKEQLINFIIENQIDAIVFDSENDFNADFIDSCSSLKLIAFKDEIEENSDIQYAKDQGIQIITVSNATSVAKAELIFAHLLGMVRFLHQSNREMPLEGDMSFNMLHKSFLGQELKGKTIGIIGMNNAGIETAKIAIGIGMKVIMTDHEPKNVLIPLEFFDGQSVEFYIEYSSFDNVISSSDFIAVNTKSENGFIFDEPQFEKMKTGVGIVNIEQGAINEVPLLKAIESKKVIFAGLDAFENQPKPEIQLLMNPELSLSPNISTKTFEAQVKMSNELVTKITESLV